MYRVTSHVQSSFRIQVPNALRRRVWETADVNAAAGAEGTCEKLLERLGFPYVSHGKKVQACPSMPRASSLHQQLCSPLQLLYWVIMVAL